MLKLDRTLIAGILLPHFPALKTATSADWQAFLNEYTGLAIGNDVPNAEAFDRWRMALAGKGIPVWGETAESIAEKKARASTMLDLENKRRAKAGELSIQLAEEAPGNTV